jgi:hypothetical protein
MSTHPAPVVNPATAKSRPRKRTVPLSADSPRIFDSWEQALTAFNQMFCYIRNVNAVVSLSDLEAFKPGPWAETQYANWWYTEMSNAGGIKYHPVARKWLQDERRNQRDHMTYLPGKSKFVGGALNRWRGLGSQPKEGDVGPWHELLHFLIPSDEPRRYFEQWLAYPLQHLGAKLTTAVVLYSRMQGVGKNILVQAVESIYGDNAVVIGESELNGGEFNQWQKDRQFVVGDEVQGGSDKRKVIERLKMLITAPSVQINLKYQPQFFIPNVANYIFLSNNPQPFHVVDEDRRFWAWEIPQEKPLPDDFYRKFHDWRKSPEGIAALHYYLLQIDTSDFNPDAKAPMTELKREMIEIGRTELERWLRDLPDEMPKRTLFTLKDLVGLWHEENEKSNCGQSAVQTALKKLNYKQAHGRKQVRVRGKQERLWVVAKPEEAERLLAVTDPSELAAEYERAFPQ